MDAQDEESSPKGKRPASCARRPHCLPILSERLPPPPTGGGTSSSGFPSAFISETDHHSDDQGGGSHLSAPSLPPAALSGQLVECEKERQQLQDLALTLQKETQNMQLRSEMHHNEAKMNVRALMKYDALERKITDHINWMVCEGEKLEAENEMLKKEVQRNKEEGAICWEKLQKINAELVKTEKANRRQMEVVQEKGEGSGEKRPKGKGSSRPLKKRTSAVGDSDVEN